MPPCRTEARAPPHTFCCEIGRGFPGPTAAPLAPQCGIGASTTRPSPRVNMCFVSCVLTKFPGATHASEVFLLHVLVGSQVRFHNRWLSPTTQLAQLSSSWCFQILWHEVKMALQCSSFLQHETRKQKQPPAPRTHVVICVEKAVVCWLVETCYPDVVSGVVRPCAVWT